jgi:hypothetical protein
MCSIAEDSHIKCEIPGFSHRNWNNVDYGVKFQEHFKKNNKDMRYDNDNDRRPGYVNVKVTRTKY